MVVFRTSGSQPGSGIPISDRMLLTTAFENLNSADALFLIDGAEPGELDCAGETGRRVYQAEQRVGPER